MKPTEGPYFIEFGDVWRIRAGGGRPSVMANDRRHVCDGTGQLAVAMLEDMILKTGSAEDVDEWVRRKAGGADVTVIRFPVTPETVEELNACVANSTRGPALVENLGRIGRDQAATVPLPGFPR